MLCYVHIQNEGSLFFSFSTPNDELINNCREILNLQRNLEFYHKTFETTSSKLLFLPHTYQSGMISKKLNNELSAREGKSAKCLCVGKNA